MKHIVLITHEVKDFTEWKAGFDAHNPVRESAGIRVIDVLADAKNQNLVTSLLEVSDMEKMNAMFGDPNFQETLQKSGVISEPEVKVLISKN